MSERLKGGASGETGEFRTYKDAGEMLNDKLFNTEFYSTFTVDEYSGEVLPDVVLLDFPENMARHYGLEESIKACEAKLQGSRVTTPAENEALYHSLNDDLMDLADEGLQEDNAGKEAYATLLQNTLDGLVGDVKDYGDGEVQTLESAASHKIAKETKMYLNMLNAGSLTDEYKTKYAERVTALTEVRGLLDRRRKSGEF